MPGFGRYFGCGFAPVPAAIAPPAWKVHPLFEGRPYDFSANEVRHARDARHRRPRQAWLDQKNWLDQKKMSVVASRR
jgi:hypothetical protein